MLIFRLDLCSFTSTLICQERSVLIIKRNLNRKKVKKLTNMNHIFTLQIAVINISLKRNQIVMNNQMSMNLLH